MISSRRSLVVRLGRLFQAIPPFCLTWIEFFFRKKTLNSYPIIAIIAPPRSGSTLTYQILSRGTKSLYLSNLWNLLYAVPLIGGLLSRNKKPANANFESNKGFVQGLYGEAEGLKFWQYWIGQGLTSTQSQVSLKRQTYIQKALGRLISADQPFISGYLGHVFSIKQLRELFPGIIFIYLKRDHLSNIYSMFKAGKDYDWFSLKPAGWELAQKLPIHDRFVWQYNEIVKQIESDISDQDTLTVNYAEICQNPMAFLDEVKHFAHENGINLCLNSHVIPDSFNESKVSASKDRDTMLISSLLKKL